MKTRFFAIGLIAATMLAGCNKDDDSPALPPEQEQEEQPSGNQPNTGNQTQGGMTLSADFGVYANSFVLTVQKTSPQNTIHYALDGGTATKSSREFPETGITIESTTTPSKFFLTPNVQSYINWEQYNYGYVDKGVCISLLELAPNGDTVSMRQGTYIVNPTIKAADIPVVCLSAQQADWIGTDKKSGLYNTYPNADNDQKYRGWLEFYDQKTGESFALNTQMKRGGNWTRSYPCRTINVNYNKDQNGNKNKIPSLDIFDGRERMDGNGSIAGSVRRFRLHSGGNACFGTLISDAFVHQLIGRKTNVSTTAWRPCMLYLNAEYWGLYQLREHYSDIYFQNNYGVDKDDVMYVDKVYTGSMSDAAYARYRFEIKEGDEAQVLAELDDLFMFLGYDYTKAPNTRAKDWNTDGWQLTGEGSKYDEFCKRVDVESLVDLVLIQGYCSNWDFMYNNFRMWRTRKKDASNPYADGRWRFCLHDVDFAFEDATADNVLKADDGAQGDGLWNTHKISVFDYYTGNAYLNTGSVPGYLKPYNYLWLYLPMQNPEFKALVKRRAEYIQQLFNVADCEKLWAEMASQLSPYINDRAKRWGGNWNYSSWQSDLDYRLWRMQHRSEYFMQQVIKAFGLEGI
ncbi:MAG: CotH kinase family protein [Bacteroidales bacterium]|nr:CotH kinase family protein [Bacteroidales bacterium]